MYEYTPPPPINALATALHKSGDKVHCTVWTEDET